MPETTTASGASGAKTKKPLNQPMATTRSRSASPGSGRRTNLLHQHANMPTAEQSRTAPLYPSLDQTTGNAIDEVIGAMDNTIPFSRGQPLHPMFYTEPQRDHRSTSHRSSHGEDQETNPRPRPFSPQPQYHTLSDDSAITLRYRLPKPQGDSRPPTYRDTEDTHIGQQRTTPPFRPPNHQQQWQSNTRPIIPQTYHYAQHQPQFTSHSQTPTSHPRGSVTTISDKLCSLEPFTGDIAKTTAEKWTEQFELYVDFKQMQQEQTLRLFKLLMHGSAASWLSALPAADKTNLTDVLQAFQSRYGLSKVQMAKTERDMWLREQGVNESVDDFVSAVTNEATRVKMSDEQLQRVLIQGFKPAIRMQVMSAGNCNTIQQMLLVARGCEAAQSGDRPSQTTTNENLSALMMQLMAKVSNVAEDNKRLLAMSQHPIMSTTPTMAPVAYASQPYQQQQPFQSAPPQQYQTYQPNMQQTQATPARKSYPNSNYHGNNFKRDYMHPNQAAKIANQQKADPQWTTNQSQQPSNGWNEPTSTQGDPTQTQGTATSQSRNQPCTFCGLEHPRGPHFCPSYGTICGHCGFPNHAVSQCYRRQNGLPPLGQT